MEGLSSTIYLVANIFDFKSHGFLPMTFSFKTFFFFQNVEMREMDIKTTTIYGNFLVTQTVKLSVVVYLVNRYS